MLHLVRALVETSVTPERMVFVTQGVHSVREESIQGVVQASVWGLGRTIALEYPNWNCTCVDVTSDSMDQVAAELLTKDDENQVALRGSERYVARLERSHADANDLVIPEQPFELVIPTPGVLENLNLQITDRRAPEAGEVEIRVRASGLNFRDVLNALGMYPGAKIPLGIECAGEITAIGQGVTEYKVGDEVIGLTTASFRSSATIPVERVFAKPVNLSIAQAASIPTIFLTAYYGLHHLAGMKAGDRVLIHAAAGGVGLAAVQLAQRAGAEIFATAGSHEKQEYLRSLGVKHIFSSRNLDFAEAIMQVTNGKGVNIILNSLADEFIPKSLSILADGGCFLEMGKRDEWDQAKVSQLNPTLKYHRYDLGTEMVNDMPFIGGMLNEILSDFEKNVFKPLPVRAFPMQSVRDAFRFMAQARHIGKIVITQDEAPVIRADSTYLVTGGLGGLGLVTARWLVERGAKHLVLMSRSEPSEETCTTLDELRGIGCEIVTVQGDIACTEDVERILQNITQRMPALRGIFHEAGVLDDGVLSQQNWSRFEKVMSPKVAGTWNLHTLTQNMDLDFFVLFSSAAAVLGSAGQGNYAVANSFMDGLAHYRRSHGLAAMSINWGSWSEVGMAAALASNRRASRDADSIQPSEGMEILEKLLRKQPAQTIVLPVNWNRFTGKQVQPLLRQIVRVKEQSRSNASAVQLLEQIKTLSPNEQQNAFQEYARQQVISILGLDASHTLHADRALTDLGLDSLMAVELKNKVEGDLHVNIPVTFFLEEATVAGLAKKLQLQINGTNGEDAKTGSVDTLDAEKAKELLSNLDQLSEDEVDALINNLLPKNEDS
jgi:myxalamid-type polyketide synthase MxaB